MSANASITKRLTFAVLLIEFVAALILIATVGNHERHVQFSVFKANLQAYLRLEGRFNPGLKAAQVPVDAVTSSASGVDPQISVANADIQARRVAAVRRLPLAQVSQLIDANTDGRSLGVLGEAGVNVLELNLALDHLPTR